MNETQQHIGAQKQARNALARVESIEKVLSEIARETDESKNRMTSVMEVMDALVQLVGINEVQTVVGENRKERALKKQEQEIAAVKNLVESGVLVSETTANTGNLLVFKETKEDGSEVLPVSRVQFMFEQLKPDFQEQLKGKEVGSKIKSDAGNFFEVREVYSVKSPPPEGEVEEANLQDTAQEQ